ncbi:MAG: HYR domain-containing protein, partial [Desulfovibrionales bacterium]|nr:HYR domain-containing protein [Desulfovibrionales bacterium]
MKKTLPKLLLLLGFVLMLNTSQAQELVIFCQADTILANTEGTCGAIVNYSEPEGANIFAYSFTGEIQTFVIPDGITEIYIEASGASGGSGDDDNYSGGSGAIMGGQFTVTPGDTIKILVGEQGVDGSTSMAGGGGGGTFIYTGELGGDGLMLAAGGGGGGSEETGQDGCDARTDNFSTSLGDNCAQNIDDGNGGDAGLTYGSGGAGGAGWLSAGQNVSSEITGGQLTLGGIGPNYGAYYGGNGGYGGGGGGGDGGGGGGGYTGGPGGDDATPGGISGAGAGGSYNAGTNQGNSTGNIGNGLVRIAYPNQDESVVTTQIAGLGSGATFPVGSTTEVYQAINSLGDTVECSFIVTVFDEEAPV